MLVMLVLGLLALEALHWLCLHLPLLGLVIFPIGEGRQVCVASGSWSVHASCGLVWLPWS